MEKVRLEAEDGANRGDIFLVLCRNVLTDILTDILTE